MKLKLYSVLIAICLSFNLHSQAAVDPGVKEGISLDRLDRYEQFIKGEIKDGKLPGAVTFIMRNGKVIHHEAFGFSDLKSQSPMKKDQIFYIQSMTKLLVSAALMTLYEEGHFLLSDRVSKYLPFLSDLKVASDMGQGSAGGLVELKRPIRIEDLFSHTAGFSHGLGNNKLEQEVNSALYGQKHADLESRVKALATMPLVGQPGEQWHYSAGPDVIALLIQHFSGQSTAEFLKERIFDPLGMEDTGYNIDPSKANRVAKVHLVSEKGIIPSPEQTPISGNTVYGGTHGLFSTTQDYGAFLSMMIQGGTYNGHQVLGKKTIELMTQNHIGDLFWQEGRGFGLGIAVTTDVAATG
ncbi:MAG: beta-lactamase family protein, partial [Saprospiraceae bacterium]|nr:beta-lactamase family protein [Saprospiraceae bacterium]